MNKKTQSKPPRHLTSGQCVCLEFSHPKAHEVFVAGSFNGWSPTASPMIAAGNGHWIKQLVLPPGRHEYRFVVEGQWFNDPKAHEFVANAHGSQNAVLVVPTSSAPQTTQSQTAKELK